MTDLINELYLLSQCCCDPWHVDLHKHFDHEDIAKRAIAMIQELEDEVCRLGGDDRRDP